MNYCPVCGYALPYPAADFHICPSCGTEFGYDDSGVTYQELRNRWLSTGPMWWSPVQPTPIDWDPAQQLMEGVFLSGTGSNTSTQSLSFGFGRTSSGVFVRRKRAARAGSWFAVRPNQLGPVAARERYQ